MLQAMNDPHLLAPEPDYADPVIEAIRKDIDRTLLRENLRLSVEERLRKGQSGMRLALSLQAAGRRAESVLFPSPKGAGK